MDIEVREVSMEVGEAWRVTADSMVFSFSCQVSALAFAAKLKERIDAPHSFPDEDYGEMYPGLGHQSLGVAAGAD